jgi:hypothetical protein
VTAVRGVKPWQLAHRGTVEAGGVLVDTPLLGEAKARARVLALWLPGARVSRAADGAYAVLFGEARPVDAAVLPGAPLVRTGGAWSAVPLTSAERERLGAPDGSLVRARVGRAEVEALTDVVDVASWLSLASLKAVEVQSLGAEPPRAALAVPPAEAPSRAAYGTAVAELAPEAKAALARLRAPGAKGGGAGVVSGVVGGLGALGTAVGKGLAGLWRSFLQPRPGAGAASGRGGKGEALAPADGAGGAGGLLSRLARGAWGLGMRALYWTRVTRLLGRRQARFVNRMLELFERQDLAEALRHAIPLGGPQAEEARPLLGLPAPRSELQVRPGGVPATSVMGGGPDLAAHLRRVYRQAFERLERAGRIDEAAFVLAELLHANAEAVDFLERHGRLRLAAELAEGRGLASDLVVRQWLLAGEGERAVAVARRTGAFASAVALLERKDPERARSLRLVWGELLAQSGDWARAVQVVRPLPEARALMGAWLERAVAGGGAVGARMLAVQAALFPERLAEVRAAAQGFLEDDGAEGAEARRALAEGLLAERKEAALGPLMRPAARALLRDRGEGRPVGEAMLAELVEASGDRALRTDWPSLPPLGAAVPVARRSAPLVQRVEADARGALPALDAAVLPGGRLLVALGEAGVRLVSREGRTVAHFAAPAERLVVSDAGTRALALAARGELWRVSRLDLSARTWRPWLELRLQSWADTYDGQGWFVAEPEPGRVVLLDALAERPRALWHLPDVTVHGPVARTTEALCFVAAEGGDFDSSWGTKAEVWRYALPGPTLRARADLRAGAPPEEARSVLFDVRPGPDGQVAYHLLHLPSQEEPDILRTLRLAVRGPNGAVVATPREAFTGSVPTCAVGAGLVVRASPDEEGLEVTGSGAAGLELRLVLRLVGAKAGWLRLQGEHLLVGDDTGRLLTVDLLTGEVGRVRLSLA